MNKRELIEKVALLSYKDTEECEEVINALQTVLEKELKSSQGVLNAFDKINHFFNIFRKDK